MDQGRWFLSVEGRTIARARVVMTEMLGRELRPDEIVHHLDSDSLNDDPSNLQLVSRADHMRIHLPRKTTQQWSARDLLAAVYYYDTGSTIDEVATRIGKSYSATRRRLSKLGVLRAPGRPSLPGGDHGALE